MATRVDCPIARVRGYRRVLP